MNTNLRNLILSMGSYVVLVIAAGMVARTLEPGTLRTIVVLLPIVPGVFVVFSVVAAIRALDEFQQRIQLEAFAFAFGALFLLALTETFLDPLGIDPAPPGVRILEMSALWLIGLLLARRRYA